MGKKIVKIEIEKKVLMAKLKSVIGDQCACFVLISCSEPSTEGQMDVQMHFEGDETLVAFLLENATQVFDEQIPKRQSK